MENRDRWTRRGALKMMGAVALASVPASRLVLPASAGRSWCRSDPGLLVGDRETHIYLHSYAEMLDLTTGPILLEVQVPPTMKEVTKLLFMDSGFGHGYDLKVNTNPNLRKSKRGDVEILVNSFAPARDDGPEGPASTWLEVHTEVIPVTLQKNAMIAKGFANMWIKDVLVKI